MLSQPRVQLALVAVAAAGALGAAGVLTGTGSAQSAGGPRTLHVVATQRSGFEPKGSFHNGTVFGFRDSVRADDGTIGRDVAACTATDVKHKESFCHVAMIFPNGQLIFEFVHRESSKPIAIAVVGGIGVYAGARGTAVAKDLSETKTDITVNLVG
jgi:hypothetical protein